MSKTKITVETTVSADTNQVWEYWTKPEHITKWNTASDDWHSPKAENNLKVGGKFRIRMEAKDGSVGFDFEGIYDEVLNHKKISYTMTDGRQAVTDFENLGSETKVTTIFDPEKENPVDFQKAGWQAILDNFKKYVESN